MYVVGGRFVVVGCLVVRLLIVDYWLLVIGCGFGSNLLLVVDCY